MNKIDEIMVQFHCESNTGYAIGRLEGVFFDVAMRLLGGDPERLHIAYTDMHSGPSDTIPPSFTNYLVIRPDMAGRNAYSWLEAYVRDHKISTVLGFDQPPRRPYYAAFRRGGVRRLISYWGAPMSSPNSGLVLLLKRLQVALYRSGPDMYIFESEGMKETATLGRGIPAAQTHVVYLGVDTTRFRPAVTCETFAHERFSIPRDRKIFLFTGHMEPRKGPQVILRAVNRLVRTRRAKDWHVLLLGNSVADRSRLEVELVGAAEREMVTFGGYFPDVDAVHRSCYAGIIASTGWDSLTCSALEMQSSGLPLLLSDLPGLREAIIHDQTGWLFRSGDDSALASLMNSILENPGRQQQMGFEARARVLRKFRRETQVTKLCELIDS